ncbi:MULTISPECIES: PLP-dependent aminotransferase family protein [Bacillus]|uniref:PLP-dependent aminotransferase family protein n=1 Tax=Bacillus glycinifermentans TaxID=1664069 RepID=A0AAJ3YXP7_9BACI|nr:MULTISPECIES: PLP-dependent aminotransferase family protein [Bacillus]KKB73397.1 GntR family transcriptional regulator [Bacillus sp. TH008]MDU0069604.1 PLP-dependent aminotransferase family protein [Bacillus sp. IG6]MED8017417.1 PLP-dependent aminotransferase family protein [Bacillus glycinifermentans]QAT64569.1 PLP-dependent aminotransferase family protein [Bacillus glycinifermentans]WKB78519.1 PLP-dependent aminotransferase family protein [Bacillus glycinifermentans]
MNNRLNRNSEIPLYQQIEQIIKGKIVKGEWPAGTKIPSQRKLADVFRVNRSTVTAAIDELTARGLLEGKRGGGTKVTNHTWKSLSAVRPLDWTSYVRSGIHRPNSTTIQEINRQEFNEGMIRLGTGELSPELLPYRQMKEVLAGAEVEQQLSLGYEEPKGNRYAREAVAEHLKRKGVNTSPDSILIVSGALQALQLIAVGLLKRRSAVLTERPSYLYSLHVFQSMEMRLFGIPVDESGLDPAFIPACKKQYGADLLYTIPSFHNPTGRQMSEDRKKELIRISKAYSLPIIEDDAYGDLWLDGPPPPPLKAFDQDGSVLYVGTLSKTVSPGLRIGWVAGPEPVIERLADIKMQTDYGSSSLSQWAAAKWLSGGLYEKHLMEIRKKLKIRRDAALRSLKAHCGAIATWEKPSGGFYIWLTFHKPLPLNTLFERALKRNVLINPGTLYDKEAKQSIRLSYSYASISDLETGIRTVAELARELM